jgi:hypothetical protein
MAEDARFSCRPRARSWFRFLTTEVVDTANGEVVAVAEARDEATADRIAELLSRAEWPKIGCEESHPGRRRLVVERA